MGRMSSLSTCARPALALVLALVLPLALSGCSSEEAVPAGERPVLAQPDNPSVASSVADPFAPRIISVVVTRGTTTGDTGVVEVRRNAPVRLVVITDTQDTVVVQGLDRSALATAEVPLQLDFIAAKAGEFRVVMKDSGLVLTRLRVG
jgi:hypothetical protein